MKKTIYLVKEGNNILLKTFSLEKAQELIFDYNFEIIKGINKAKLYKATIKTTI
jgi:hypothetical protein